MIVIKAQAKKAKVKTAKKALVKAREVPVPTTPVVSTPTPTTAHASFSVVDLFVPPLLRVGVPAATIGATYTVKPFIPKD